MRASVHVSVLLVCSFESLSAFVFTELRMFTGDTSKRQSLTSYQLECYQSLVLTREVNLVTESSAYSAGEIRETEHLAEGGV